MSTCLDSSLELGCELSTFADLLAYRAQNQPNRTAYTFLHRGETEVGKLTYQELDRQARAIAARLQSMRAIGERALLLYQPGLEFVAAFMGCMYASVVAVPAYPPRRNQKLTRLQAILDNARAMVVLTTATLLENIERRFAEDPKLATMQWLTTDNIPNELASDWQKPTISSNTIAFLQYTSGSTGTPKGVMVSHGNLLHNSALIHQCFEHTPDSRGVIWLPPYHDMGLIGGVLQPLYGGFPVALMSPVDFLQQPLRWLQAISRYRGTTSGGPNFAYELACSKITPEQKASLDLSSWEVAFTGAEPVRAETLERFAATFEPCGFRREAFYPCYGMAETTLIVSGGLKAATPIVQQVEGAALEQNRVIAARGEESTRKLVGCGKSLVDGKIAIVDPKTSTLLPDNQVGEIWVASPSVAQGYWERPEETEATFNAYLADTGEGPFLRTGDLGFLQEGELFIAGRIKDAIIIRGQNHYPQDIELTVEKCHPALRPNCGAAFAVEVNGSERLVIVQEVKRSYLRKLNVKEVVESIRRAVTAEHNLQVYATVLVKTESIPKTSSGKIQRHACRAGFLAGTLNVVEDWSENPKSKVKFLQLQADVESILEKLKAVKRVSNQ
ncbi:AMP-dependent synthetase [Hydrococcus rivularis NIES-593]|uniref:AMP-dependent synthetase n=1 Tax=Hydrococcus rivularis NIES-593 TaxID=1921803 RepID=A0A1U7HC44_9CYAN|nr:fatty acyl-AMP ligase [Hydrococcus rivularis]OKH21105.1 AMP-dependent synthetase [Hydrococcus rivularis NIES-593]